MNERERAKKYILRSLMAILIVIMLLCLPKIACAKELDSQNNQEEYSSYRLGLSNKFNLRDDLKTLKIKDQKQTEQCWAFVTTTQIESYMMLKRNSNVEFSPRHIEYSTARTFLDGINEDGYYREVNSGGNFFYSYGYLTSGKGPILESQMPFENTSSKINLSEIKGKTVQLQLEEYRTFSPIYKEKNDNKIIYTNGKTGENRIEYTQTQVNNIRNEIKKHIIEYGAVGSITSTNSYQFYSNEENYTLSSAYNCDDSSVQPNHAVAIIGWDDNYDASNFNENHRPTKNGAWIIQNSYGKEKTLGNGTTQRVFEDGILYISYEDFLIERLIFGIIKLDDVDYEYIYQYDELGENAVLPITGSSAYAVNIFDKQTQTEYITEIGLYLNGSTSYTYDIYINSDNGTIDLEKFKHVKQITGTNSNYITVELDKPLKINGTQFAVAVKYTNEDTTTDIPIEAKLTKVDAWYSATANKGESFISQDGLKWYDINELSVASVENMNVCIKAFTTNQVDYLISTDKYNIISNMISNIPAGTSVNTFLNNINTNGNIKIYDSNNKEVNGSKLISTGMKLRITDTNQDYSISVSGDINGDGKNTAADLLLVKRALAGLITLNEPYTTSSDLNGKDKLTVTDLLLLKQSICKLVNK